MTSFAFILGVVPMVVANGAGAEMRWSLGTAVFSGMLGVTLFGILLTPVFFYVIDRLGAGGFFGSPAMHRALSIGLGAGLGALAGFLGFKAGVPMPLPYALVVGGAIGVAVGTGVELARWRKARSDGATR
jgi:multidrug efflux pump